LTAAAAGGQHMALSDRQPVVAQSHAAVLPRRIVRSVHLPVAPLVLDRAVTGGIPAYVARLLTDLLVSIDRRPSSWKR
jgi:hypothetical protein